MSDAWPPKSKFKQLLCRPSGDTREFEWLEPAALPSESATISSPEGELPPKPIGLRPLFQSFKHTAPPSYENISFEPESATISSPQGELDHHPPPKPIGLRPLFQSFKQTALPSYENLSLEPTPQVLFESVFIPLDTLPLVDPTVIKAHSGANARVRVVVELEGTKGQIARAKMSIKDVVQEFDDPVLDFTGRYGSGFIYKTGSFPTKVVCLSHVVTPEKLIHDKYYEEKLELVRNEGAKYGELLKVVIPRPGPKGELGPGVGKVFLEYEDNVGSCKAKLDLNEMEFGEGHAVAVFYPETKFARREYDG